MMGGAEQIHAPIAGLPVNAVRERAIADVNDVCRRQADRLGEALKENAKLRGELAEATSIIERLRAER